MNISRGHARPDDLAGIVDVVGNEQSTKGRISYREFIQIGDRPDATKPPTDSPEDQRKRQ